MVAATAWTQGLLVIGADSGDAVEAEPTEATVLRVTSEASIDGQAGSWTAIADSDVVLDVGELAVRADDLNTTRYPIYRLVCSEAEVRASDVPAPANTP
jgi:hypothetical protein